MNPEIKHRWVNALRSGKYNQGEHLLQNKSGAFCCLGVLCDLYSKEKGVKWETPNKDLHPEIYGISDVLPSPVMEWAGLKECDPNVEIDGTYHGLAFLNDGEYFNSDSGEFEYFSFSRLADIIEEQL